MRYDGCDRGPSHYVVVGGHQGGRRPGRRPGGVRRGSRWSVRRGSRWSVEGDGRGAVRVTLHRRKVRVLTGQRRFRHDHDEQQRQRQRQRTLQTERPQDQDLSSSTTIAALITHNGMTLVDNKRISDQVEKKINTLM